MWAPQSNWLLGTSSNGCSLNICQHLFRREAEHCLSKDLVATGHLSVPFLLPLPSSALHLRPKPTSLTTAEPAVVLNLLLKRQLSRPFLLPEITSWPHSLPHMSYQSVPSTLQSFPQGTNILVNTGYFP